MVCAKVVTARMIEVYGEVTEWQNQWDVNRYAHGRHGRGRVEDGTHLNWKTVGMMLPTKEDVGLGDRERW